MKIGAMAWKVIVGLGMAIAFSVWVVLAEEPDKAKAALSSAETWLSFADEGKYSDRWNEAANYFKSAMGRLRFYCSCIMVTHRLQLETDTR